MLYRRRAGAAGRERPRSESKFLSRGVVHFGRQLHRRRAYGNAVHFLYRAGTPHGGKGLAGSGGKQFTAVVLVRPGNRGCHLAASGWRPAADYLRNCNFVAASARALQEKMVSSGRGACGCVASSTAALDDKKLD